MGLDPLKGGSVFDIRSGRLGTGGTLAEKVFQFGVYCNLDAVVPLLGRAIRSTHSWRLVKGPEKMLPSPSIAYQPDFMPRMSDLCSLM
jgi:hypothetical protein